MNNEIKVTPNSEGVLAIYQGTCLPQREPLLINLKGDINTVGSFLAKRKPQSEAIASAPPADNNAALPTAAKFLSPGPGLQTIDIERAVVIVDKEAMTMELELDPEFYYGAKVSGKLELAKELEIFSLNEEVELSREDCIKLFRFNKFHFATPEKADDLTKAFQKFSAKSHVELTKEDDTRGNVQASVSKKVETGIPQAFELFIPIYKGQPKEKIEVTICLDVVGTRVIFWFESVQLIELLEQRKEEIFAKQLEACTDFPVIYK